MNTYLNRTVFVILILVILGLLSPQIAHSQGVEVNSADPNSAAQGTFGLDVKLKGKGFEKGAKVRFFLYETEEDGGIIVNSVKVRGSKSLIVNIDVLNDAVIADFNVEVELLNRRKGKGTTRLFAVKAEQEDTPGGEHRSLTVTFDALDIRSSNGFPYGDSEKGVYARLGGQTQPNKPGFKVGLKKAGQKSRQVTVDLSCSDAGGLLPDNCDLLPSNPLTITGSGVHLFLRPYEMHCPEPLNNGECPDAFTMGTGMGNSEYMSFRVDFFSENLFIEVASAIGGADYPNPGRCLSLLSEADRSNFLDEQCADPANCNVLVEAFDNGDLNGAGAGDGENDEWRIDASSVVALICNLFKPAFVYGMTELSFGVTAIKE